MDNPWNFAKSDWYIVPNGQYHRVKYEISAFFHEALYSKRKEGKRGNTNNLF
jgi:hypothetical protein